MSRMRALEASGSGAFGSVGSMGVRRFLITLCVCPDPISPS